MSFFDTTRIEAQAERQAIRIRELEAERDEYKSQADGYYHEAADALEKVIKLEHMCKWLAEAAVGEPDEEEIKIYLAAARRECEQ